MPSGPISKVSQIEKLNGFLKLDKTINLGTIIHLIVLIASMVVLYSGIVTRMSAMETKVDAMWQIFLRRGIVDIK